MTNTDVELISLMITSLNALDEEYRAKHPEVYEEMPNFESIYKCIADGYRDVIETWESTFKK